MKTFKKHYSFVNAICLLFIFLFIAACGPSKEEIEKRKQEEKAKIDLAVGIFKKHKPEADVFIKKLQEIKGILTRQDSFSVYSGDMDPVLKAGSYNDSANVIVLSQESLLDTLGEVTYGDIFGIYFSGRHTMALDDYRKIATGKVSEIYDFSYTEKEEVERMAASLSVKNTPYALVVKRDTIVPIKIEGEKSYSGGETAGYAWLIDLRKMEILGHFNIFAVPSSISVKKSEGNYSIQEKAKSSSNSDANAQITTWLSKFKGSQVK